MFKRLMTILRGFVGLFIKSVERNNPEALLEAEKEKLRASISQFNQGLAGLAGLVEKLTGQHKKAKQEEVDLKAKITTLLQAGKRELAAELAVRFQEVDRLEDSLMEQMEAANTRYQEMTRARDVAVKDARAKIEKLTNGLSELKVNQSMADLNEMANSMIGSMGGSGDTLNRLEEMIEEERTKAAGRARVAKDSVDLSQIDVMEDAQKLDGQAALAMFEAEMGINSPVTATETAAPVTMGPLAS